MALSCFSVCTLHHIQASNKHSVVCHLWHPNLLLWHAFWRIVSPMTSTLSHKSDPRFGRNWEWNNPTSPVQCSFVKIWLSPWLGYEWKFAMAVTTQRNPSCEARFPWKNFRNQGAAGRITCKFTITSERKTGLPEKTEESEPNECGRIPARRIFFGKDKECGSDNRITCKFTITSKARRTFIEKTHGVWKGFRDARFSWKKIRNPGAVGRVSYEFTVTLNARRILPEKTQGKWTQGMRQDYCEAHFRRKKTRYVGAIDRITYKFTITLNARGAFIEKTHGIWKGFRDARFSWKKIRNPGAVGRASYEFTVTLNAKRILPEKTQGIWGGRYNAHFHWKTQGVGRGWSSVTYKFTVKMKPRGNLYGIHNDFSGVGGGLRRGCILIRNRDGVLMTCAPHGNVARHSKDTSTHSSIWRLQGFGVGFRGGAWGVGFRGFGVGFRGGVVLPCAQHGNVARYSKDNYASVHGMWNQHSKQTWIALEKTDCYPQLRSFSFFALKNIYSEMLQNSTTMPVSMECEINTQNKPGSPWRTLVAIHNFVASAFLHYKISTQKCFRPC